MSTSCSTPNFRSDYTEGIRGRKEETILKNLHHKMVSLNNTLGNDHHFYICVFVRVCDNIKKILKRNEEIL